MEQAIINVEGTTTIETAAAAKKLIEMFGNRNIRAIAVNRVNDKSDEVIVELDFVPGLAPHLHGFTLQVNGLTSQPPQACDFSHELGGFSLDL